MYNLHTDDIPVSSWGSFPPYTSVSDYSPKSSSPLQKAVKILINCYIPACVMQLGIKTPSASARKKEDNKYVAEKGS